MKGNLYLNGKNDVRNINFSKYNFIEHIHALFLHLKWKKKNTTYYMLNRQPKNMYSFSPIFSLPLIYASTFIGSNSYTICSPIEATSYFSFEYDLFSFLTSLTN